MSRELLPLLPLVFYKEPDSFLPGLSAVRVSGIYWNAKTLEPQMTMSAKNLAPYCGTSWIMQTGRPRSRFRI